MSVRILGEFGSADDVEIFGVDDFAGPVLVDFGQDLVWWLAHGEQVVEDQFAGLDLCGDAAEVGAGGVIGGVIFLPVGGAGFPTLLRLDLVDEDVGALGGGDEGGAVGGVAADHDHFILALEAITVGVLPRAVGDGKGDDAESIVAVDFAAADIVGIDREGGGGVRLGAVQADIEILGPGVQDVSGHGAEAGRAVGLEGIGAAGVGGSEDEVGVAGGVIGVEMGDEDAGEPLH